MYRSDRWLSKLHFGNDERQVYVRIELLKWDRVALTVRFHQPPGMILRTDLLGRAGPKEFTLADRHGQTVTRKSLATGEVVELAISLKDLQLAPGMPVSFQVQLTHDEMEAESFPANVPIEFALLDEELALHHWIV
jgi:hypothetical protein